VPFSLDNLTGSTSHDFVYRSVAARTISPGRDRCASVGSLDGRRFTYFVGVFGRRRRDDATKCSTTTRAGSAQTFSTRVTIQPLDAVDRLPRPSQPRTGVNGGSSTVPEG
jgi:hypothetical protein